jgi:hypothetical protein
MNAGDTSAITRPNGALKTKHSESKYESYSCLPDLKVVCFDVVPNFLDYLGPALALGTHKSCHGRRQAVKLGEASPSLALPVETNDDEDIDR